MFSGKAQKELSGILGRVSRAMLIMILKVAGNMSEAPRALKCLAKAATSKTESHPCPGTFPPESTTVPSFGMRSERTRFTLLRDGKPKTFRWRSSRWKFRLRWNRKCPRLISARTLVAIHAFPEWGGEGGGGGNAARFAKKKSSRRKIRSRS